MAFLLIPCALLGLLTQYSRATTLTYPDSSNPPTVNTIDTVDVSYTCSYSQCNLTLYCPQDNYNNYWWGYQENYDPISAGSGSYRIPQIGEIFLTGELTYPVTCHFALSPWGDDTASNINGGNFILVSTSGAAKIFAAATTQTAYTATTVPGTTTSSTITRTSGSPAKITADPVSSKTGASASASAPPSSSASAGGLSTGAKAGLGIGIALGLLALAAGFLALPWTRRELGFTRIEQSDTQLLDRTSSKMVNPHPDQQRYSSSESGNWHSHQLDGNNLYEAYGHQVYETPGRQVYESDSTRIPPSSAGKHFELYS